MAIGAVLVTMAVVFVTAEVAGLVNVGLPKSVTFPPSTLGAVVSVFAETGDPNIDDVVVGVPKIGLPTTAGVLLIVDFDDPNIFEPVDIKFGALPRTTDPEDLLLPKKDEAELATAELVVGDIAEPNRFEPVDVEFKVLPRTKDPEDLLLSKKDGAELATAESVLLELKLELENPLLTLGVLEGKTTELGVELDSFLRFIAVEGELPNPNDVLLESEAPELLGTAVVELVLLEISVLPN